MNINKKIEIITPNNKFVLSSNIDAKKMGEDTYIFTPKLIKFIEK